MQELDPRLQLVPAGSNARWLMFGLCVALPLFTTGAALYWAVASGDPLKLIADSLPLTIALVIGGIGAFVLLLWGLLDRAMRRHRLSLTPSMLEVKTSFYSDKVALSEMMLDQARVIDLDEHVELRPRVKTNGYALPGFKSGHFRLKNGQKAFVAIAGERRALWIPTLRGKGLLLQPHQPDALLKRLHELSAALAGPPVRR